MDNNKNRGHINNKARVEIPEELYELISLTRCNTSPFTVVQINEENQAVFRRWTQYLSNVIARNAHFQQDQLENVTFF